MFDGNPWFSEHQSHMSSHECFSPGFVELQFSNLGFLRLQISFISIIAVNIFYINSLLLSLFF